MVESGVVESGAVGTHVGTWSCEAETLGTGGQVEWGFTRGVGGWCGTVGTHPRAVCLASPRIPCFSPPMGFFGIEMHPPLPSPPLPSPPLSIPSPSPSRPLPSPPLPSPLPHLACVELQCLEPRRQAARQIHEQPRVKQHLRGEEWEGGRGGGGRWWEGGGGRGEAGEIRREHTHT